MQSKVTHAALYRFPFDSAPFSVFDGTQTFAGGGWIGGGAFVLVPTVELFFDGFILIGGKYVYYLANFKKQVAIMHRA